MSDETQFLIDCIVEKMTIYLMRDDDISMLDAMNIIYHSQVYEKILNLETGLYYQSAAYNYQLLRHELEFGKIA